MTPEIFSAWTCPECDVEGRSPAGDAVTCWNCDGPVVVTARPVVRSRTDWLREAG
ncbi:MAG: hypothetical protein ACRDYU_07720 [Actinomycetes bacterium]